MKFILPFLVVVGLTAVEQVTAARPRGPSPPNLDCPVPIPVFDAQGQWTIHKGQTYEDLVEAYKRFRCKVIDANYSAWCTNALGFDQSSSKIFIMPRPRDIAPPCDTIYVKPDQSIFMDVGLRTAWFLPENVEDGFDYPFVEYLLQIENATSVPARSRIAMLGAIDNFFYTDSRNMCTIDGCEVDCLGYYAASRLFDLSDGCFELGITSPMFLRLASFFWLLPPLKSGLHTITVQGYQKNWYFDFLLSKVGETPGTGLYDMQWSRTYKICVGGGCEDDNVNYSGKKGGKKRSVRRAVLESDGEYTNTNQETHASHDILKTKYGYRLS